MEGAQSTPARSAVRAVHIRREPRGTDAGAPVDLAIEAGTLTLLEGPGAVDLAHALAGRHRVHGELWVAATRVDLLGEADLRAWRSQRVGTVLTPVDEGAWDHLTARVAAVPATAKMSTSEKVAVAMLDLTRADVQRTVSRLALDTVAQVLLVAAVDPDLVVVAPERADGDRTPLDALPLLATFVGVGGRTVVAVVPPYAPAGARVVHCPPW